MRRPSPLPSTPTTRRPADASRRQAEEAATAQPPVVDLSAGEESAADVRVTEVVEPVRPGRMGRILPFSPSEPSGDDDAVESGPDAGAERALSMRDVWAAARARRRALRREVRRFTVRQRRRRYAWLGGLAAVAVVGLVAVATAYSPLFAVSKITVMGTDRLAPAAVEKALAGEMGTPLALVDSSDVKAALVAFPLVESYSIEARPPQELVVRIVERTPVGVVSTRAGFSLVDAAGVVLATTKDAPDGYPLIDASGGAGSRAFRAVGAVYRSLPADLRAQITGMSATTPDDVTLSVDGADVVWGSSDEPLEKARVLRAAMTAKPPSEVKVYDVSSPAAVVIR
ncbi:FtsQ-type POTRA domain-containing protein [Microbacterium sp. NPDC091382]|uniref:FtsQ-type POTRA domain-containing protein n=1 Tax=Microbacterium sp. NPDC091382 TaxID=3364210 RepID=UPI00380B580C